MHLSDHLSITELIEDEEYSAGGALSPFPAQCVLTSHPIASIGRCPKMW
jgi:hypothetical protein